MTDVEPRRDRRDRIREEREKTLAARAAARIRGWSPGARVSPSTALALAESAQLPAPDGPAQRRRARRRADSGHAGLSLVVPAGLACILLILAGASGHLGYLIAHLPHPDAQIVAAALLLVLVGARWSSRQGQTRAPEPDGEPFDPPRRRVDPWFGTDGEKWPVSDPDPDVARRPLLPADAEGGNRS